jgi:hypothetical protein
MKPKLLSDVLRQSSPRKFLQGNPYAVLRDVSPACSVRSTASTARSIPVKRKNFDNENFLQPRVQYSYADITQGHSFGQEVIIPEAVSEEIAKVKSICDKVVKDISMDGLDPKLVTIFSAINEAVYGVCKTQKMIVEHIYKVNPTPPPPLARYFHPPAR